MHRPTHLLFAVLCGSVAHAHADPGHPATVGEHLLTVNGHWAVMATTIVDDAPTVRFDTDAERIAEHLHRVHAHLSAFAPEGFSSDALAERRALLDRLHGYADRGLFPINDVVPGRSPVFIDAQGTACAVGYLIIASGHAAIAEHIHRDMNLAYVPDIALPEMGTWAATHGFTIDELAWIQPTYDFGRFAEPALLVSLQLANGDVIAVEGPKNGATQQLRVVLKSEEGEALLAKLPMLSAVQAVELNGHVFIGGIAHDPEVRTDVFEWTGRKWIHHDPFTGTAGIEALYVLDGRIHAHSVMSVDGGMSEKMLSEDGAWTLVEAPIIMPRTNDSLPEGRVP